jgi:mRNA interferase MazF
VTYRRWDVVAVPYPFIEGDESKRRPALIVSSEALNASHGVFWVAMITTAKAGKRPDDIAITDYRQAGLPESCVIRVSRLATLSDVHVAYRLGTITARDRRAVTGLLRRYLP